MVLASPKTTVLIVTYNHESFIEQAIEGALSQRCDHPFEILIADDASTDGTRSILDRYRRSGDPRLRFFLPDQHLGNHGNDLLIAAFAECRGEYVAWLDGDDYWTDDAKLQTMVRALDEHPGWPAAFHAAAGYVAPPGKKSVYGFEDLLWNNFVPSSAVVYRRAAIPPLEPYRDIIMLDWVLHLFAARNGGIGYVDRVMAVYRVHPGGVWSRLTQLERMESITAFQARIPELFGYDTRSYRKRMARAWAALAVAENAAHRRDETRDAARKAIEADRRSPAVLLTLAAAFTLPAFLLRAFARVTAAIGRRMRRWSTA